MKVIRKNKQKKINSDTCGSLREVINDREISIAIFENIEPTEKHFHKKMVEYYFLLEGWIEMRIDSSGGEKSIRLEKGDVVKIERCENHEITRSSDENKMICVNNPGFLEGDEYFD